MYVLQRRGSGRDTLSYGMADKDTHPHHNLLHSSSSAPSPAPPSSSSTTSSRHHHHHRPAAASKQIRAAPPFTPHQHAKSQHQQQQLQIQQPQNHRNLKPLSPPAPRGNPHPHPHPHPQPHPHRNLKRSPSPGQPQQQQQQLRVSGKASHRPLSDDDSGPLSPKKKKLKLILKLPKPQEGSPEVPAPGSKPNVVGLGSPSRGSGAPAPASRAAIGHLHQGSRLRNGAPGSGSPAAASGIELRQRSSVAASASESPSPAEVEGMHSSRKRKLREIPRAEEKTPAPAPPAAPAPPPPAAPGDDERRMKEKVSTRTTPAPNPTPASAGQSPLHRVMEELLEKLQKKDTYGVFAEPVDPEEIPDYLEIIKEPMDFSTIKKKLGKGVYTSMELFERDVLLVSSNAMKYNAPKTIYYKQAKAIKDIARKAFDSLKGRLNGQKRPVGRPSLKSKRNAVRKCGELGNSDGGAAASAPEGKRGAPHGSDRASDLTHKSNSPFQNSGNDHDFPEGSLAKSLSLKENRRLLAVDENRRHTYKPPGGADDEGPVQLIPFGLQGGGSYAQSLALFGAGFNRTAWEFVARKIRKVLPPNIHFGPGWVGEQDAPPVSLQAPSEASREQSKADTPVSVVFPGSAVGASAVGSSAVGASAVGVSASLPGRTLPVHAPPNGLFPGSEAFLKAQSGAPPSSSGKQHWIQSSPGSQLRHPHPQSKASPQQIAPVVPQHQQQLTDPLRQRHPDTTTASQPRHHSDVGSSHLFGNLEASRAAGKQQDLRTMEAGSQFRILEPANSQQSRDSSSNSRKSETTTTLHPRNGESGFQPASRSSELQQRRGGIDINSHSHSQHRNGVDSHSHPHPQARGNIDVNLQQHVPRNTSDRISMDSSSLTTTSLDVNSNTQPLRKPEALQQQGQLRGLEASRFAPTSLGGGFTGMEQQQQQQQLQSSGGRGVWSLQRALAQESALREGSKVQKGFVESQVGATRGGVEAGSGSGSFSSPAFQNLMGQQLQQHQQQQQQQGRDLFHLPAGLNNISKLSTQQQQHHHQRQISDLNSRSDAQFFRQAGEFSTSQPEQQQQQGAPLGVYNVLSQSLLSQQPWKNQRLMQQQQHQHQHQHQQQQSSGGSLRQLPPDLNVRLQSPTSPQHQSLHHQQQQQQSQLHHQLQQQQQQQMQQPDLALQL